MISHCWLVINQSCAPVRFSPLTKPRSFAHSSLPLTRRTSSTKSIQVALKNTVQNMCSLSQPDPDTQDPIFPRPTIVDLPDSAQLGLCSTLVQSALLQLDHHARVLQVALQVLNQVVFDV